MRVADEEFASEDGVERDDHYRDDELGYDRREWGGLPSWKIIPASMTLLP